MIHYTGTRPTESKRRRPMCANAGCHADFIGYLVLLYCPQKVEPDAIVPRPGSVAVERSPGMREVCGSIPGCIKQKTLNLKICCSA